MKSTAFQLKAFKHEGVLLNLTGYRDEDECVIERVTAADSEIDLFELLPTSVIVTLARLADIKLAAQARQQNAEARAERHQWHKEFRVAA